MLPIFEHYEICLTSQSHLQSLTHFYCNISPDSISCFLTQIQAPSLQYILCPLNTQLRLLLLFRHNLKYFKANTSVFHQHQNLPSLVWNLRPVVHDEWLLRINPLSLTLLYTMRICII